MRLGLLSGLRFGVKGLTFGYAVGYEKLFRKYSFRGYSVGPCGMRHRRDMAGYPNRFLVRIRSNISSYPAVLV